MINLTQKLKIERMNISNQTLLVLSLFFGFFTLCNCTYPAHFNFTNDTFTSLNTISKNGLDLVLNNQTLLDNEGGFVRTDKDNSISFAGSITKGSSDYSYSINMWVYIFDEVYDSVLF